MELAQNTIVMAVIASVPGVRLFLHRTQEMAASAPRIALIKTIPIDPKSLQMGER